MTEPRTETQDVDAVLALVHDLQQRIAELETTVARLTPAAAQPTAETPTTTRQPDTGLSRRRLIHMVGSGAAVGVAAVGATVAAATPAAADPGNPLVIGANNGGANTITALTAGPGPNSSTLAAINTNTDHPIGLYGVAGDTSGLPVDGGGVVGNSHDQYGVAGFSSTNIGVYGISSSQPGVYGSSNSSVAVYATSSGGTAAYAVSFAPSDSNVVGVFGYAKNNPGVLGESDTTHGVIGLAQGAPRGNVTTSGLLGQATSGRGVTGVATTGAGVAGQAGAGIGISGTAAATGIAAQFSGGRAQLYLVPSATVTGHPTTGTHKIGELFLDKTGALYLCKTAGTPGTWKLLG